MEPSVNTAKGLLETLLTAFGPTVTALLLLGGFWIWNNRGIKKRKSDDESDKAELRPNARMFANNIERIADHTKGLSAMVRDNTFSLERATHSIDQLAIMVSDHAKEARESQERTRDHLDRLNERLVHVEATLNRR